MTIESHLPDDVRDDARHKARQWGASSAALLDARTDAAAQVAYAAGLSAGYAQAAEALTCGSLLPEARNLAVQAVGQGSTYNIEIGLWTYASSPAILAYAALAAAASALVEMI